MRRPLLTLALLVFSLSTACGDSTGTGGSGGSPSDGGNGGTPSTGGNGGTPSTGGNGGTPSTGGNGGTPSTGGNGGTSSDGGNGGTSSDGGNGGDGGSGGSPPVLVNGCNELTAEDHTNEANVNLTWSFPHQKCIKIAAGTTVTWSGSFVSHPLSGGVTPTSDATSPITTTNQSGATASVTFPTAGDFPYFCEIHLGSMQGVVYVQ